LPSLCVLPWKIRALVYLITSRTRDVTSRVQRAGLPARNITAIAGVVGNQAARPQPECEAAAFGPESYRGVPARPQVAHASMGATPAWAGAA
jgi:hypothetical protein